jgi:integrase
LLATARNENSPYYVALLTVIRCGLRAGELWGLEWGDIEWQKGQLQVRRTLWRGKFRTPKTQSSQRTVDLTWDRLSELKRWKLACPINNDDLVFPSQLGERVNHENMMNRHFRPFLRKAGLPAVTLHSLRHTNASMRIHAGQNIKYLSRQLGHGSIKITLDTYGHLFEDADFTRQQVEMLENFDSVRKPLEESAQERQCSMYPPSNHS